MNKMALAVNSIPIIFFGMIFICLFGPIIIALLRQSKTKMINNNTEKFGKTTLAFIKEELRDKLTVGRHFVIIAFINENDKFETKKFVEFAPYNSEILYNFRQGDFVEIKYYKNDANIIRHINISELPNKELMELQEHFPEYFGVISESLQENKCATCGGKINSDMKACPFCGADLN